jgi:hypothetical protein
VLSVDRFVGIFEGTNIATPGTQFEGTNIVTPGTQFEDTNIATPGTQFEGTNIATPGTHDTLNLFLYSEAAKVEAEG